MGKYGQHTDSVSGFISFFFCEVKGAGQRSAAPRSEKCFYKFLISREFGVECR
jgi:hypothetical protein